MGLEHYILRGHEPVMVGLLEWAAWMETGGYLRRVAQTYVGNRRVSTVFLGLDHNWTEKGPPILFETMAFSAEDGNWDDELCERYATWEEAEAGHQAIVQRLQAQSHVTFG